MTLKEQQKLRDDLAILHKSVTLGWCFKKIKTWHDVYQKLGWPDMPNWQSAIQSNDELKAFLQKQVAELEERIKNDNSNPVTQSESKSIQSTMVQPATILSTGRIEDAREVNRTETGLSKESNSQAQGMVTSTSTISAENDYGLPTITTWKAFHYWFQKKAIKEILDKILGFDISVCKSFDDIRRIYYDDSIKKNPKSGILLLSGTGTGKTFMVAAVCHVLHHLLYHDGKTISHMPYLYVTKTTVVEQACRVFRNFYNIDPVNDVEIINIEQLRSQAGQFWVKEAVRMLPSGEEEPYWKWKQLVNPCVIFFDESQGAKNVGKSIQSEIMCSYNDLPKNACLISISATPFTRICEAKCFAVSTHKDITYILGRRSPFPEGTKLTNENWTEYASMVASPAKPDDYNQAAIERLMEDLKDYIVRVRNVRPQFEAKNGIKIIDFESPEKAKFYHEAWERFLKKKAELEAQQLAGGVASGICILVELQQYAMAAEKCHAEGFAAEMYHAVQEGFAACAAVKFKGTIIEIVRVLNEKYGVSRDKISLVWGGGQTQLTKKQEAKKDIKAKRKALEAAGIDVDEMLSQLDLDDVEDREILKLPEHLRLGAQGLDDRQLEIDKFQRGDSLYCCYTFRAGGVGLSLHHCDEITKFKCRRKESGYAVEEDIPKVPVRPRHTVVALTYNAIELVQGVGRVPRLTSLSPTVQNVYCYRNTVEVDIGRIVSQKLRCLSSVVKQKEDWQDVIMGAKTAEERGKKVLEALSTTEGVEDEQGLIDEGEGDEE